jgi:hypothetical protein
MLNQATIQAEADKVDALLNSTEPMPMYDITRLEGVQAALQWVLGVYSNSPTQED